MDWFFFETKTNQLAHITSDSSFSILFKTKAVEGKSYRESFLFVFLYRLV